MFIKLVFFFSNIFYFNKIFFIVLRNKEIYQMLDNDLCIDGKLILLDYATSDPHAIREEYKKLLSNIIIKKEMLSMYKNANSFS